MYDNDKRPAMIALGIGLAVLMAAGVIVFFVADSGAGSAALWTMPMILVLLVILALAAIMGLRQMRPRRVKRDWSGDPREVIDQLVEDINEEEARFLWRKINHARRQELADSLDSYFSSREGDRQSGQR